jgi:D-glycero-alpha-D-manno-heptose-7-phosphate kinase
LGLSGGKQDQYAAAFGGFNYMEFLKNDMVIVNPLKMKRWIIDELEASMVLYFTGRSRESANIIDQQKSNTSKGNSDAIEAMHVIKQTAVDTKLALLKGDINGFAEILRIGWENKKKMANQITNPVIQEAMDTAMAAGAKAGKISGAGGGGFIMFVVEPTRKKEVINALAKLDGFVMPFNFSDGGAHGWKIYPTDKVSSLSR